MSFLSRTLRTRLAAIAALSAVTFTAACSSDSITQPDFTPRNGATSLSLEAMTALIAATPLTRDVSVPVGVSRSFTFTKRGGTMELKEQGLRVDVPDGAIPGTTLTITVTALPGNAVAYDFQPHGTKFLKPLVFKQDLNHTSWGKLGFKGTLQGGYFKDKSQINLLKGTALLDEIFSVKLTDKNASFNIYHFSGYMVSSGRQSSSTSEAF